MVDAKREVGNIFQVAVVDECGRNLSKALNRIVVADVVNHDAPRWEVSLLVDLGELHTNIDPVENADDLRFGKFRDSIALLQKNRISRVLHNHSVLL